MVDETCNWCRNLAGTHTYPDGKYFARHDNCDCLIVASGYGSRNGVVKNYRKSSAQAADRTLTDIFSDVDPGVGGVRREGGLQIPSSKTHEKDTLKWLEKKVGGDYIMLDETNIQGVKTPDATRNNAEILEIKQVSSKSSIDTHLREAIKQTSIDNLRRTAINRPLSMTKIALFDARAGSFCMSATRDEVYSVIKRRVQRTLLGGGNVDLDYVVLKQGDEVMVFQV